MILLYGKGLINELERKITKGKYLL